MQCSSLNAELNRKIQFLARLIHVVILRVHTISSYMFVLNYSSTVRERHLGDVFRNPTTHELLRSKPEITNDENVALFLKVQDFIIKSKIFEQ